MDNITEVKPKVKDYQMMMHIASDKKHSSISKGIISWHGNAIDGKKLVVETHTPKKKNGDFGNSDVSYYLDEPNSPIFDSITKFYKSYK